MVLVRYAAAPRCRFQPKEMLKNLPPMLADPVTIDAVHTMHHKEYFLYNLRLWGLPRPGNNWATYHVYPLNLTRPRTDGADGITPGMSLAFGKGTHRSRRTHRLRPMPPTSITSQPLYLWHETSLPVRIPYIPKECRPSDMIMFDLKSQFRVKKWINKTNGRNSRNLTVPSAAVASADLPENIDGFRSEILVRALYDILADDFERAGKTILDPRRDILNWSERPGDPMIPLFEPCVGKVTVDEGIGGIYDLVREINELTLVILKAVARHLRNRPFLSE
ncbi:hypothetical protein OH76DRAFT_1396876 [Lentinus brumalis]|uniref:Uncharacterized protein n=1 Tax=Lentinus brumalis TaxID=2498619 RepID=A0A371DSG8_9APHY|nr:hypothetical protein OH76DRAFT_1396876 [Polyporus brumalis]